MKAWKRSRLATERQRRRATGRLTALVAAMAALLAVGVMSAGQANAIEPPDETPPNPVTWTLVNVNNGRCLDLLSSSSSALAARPCNGSTSQRFQTLYSIGYASIRNVHNQLCAEMFANLEVFSRRCDGASSVRWTPVQLLNGLMQWRSLHNGLCLAQGAPWGSQNAARLEGVPCSDSGTLWRFG